jgi:hypothetical protein
MRKGLFLAVSLFPVMVLAQAVAPSGSPLPLAGAVTAVGSATAWLPGSIPSGVLIIIGFIVTELAAHGIPTSKPVSWFLGLNAVVGAVIMLLQKCQTLLTTLGNSLQNTTGQSS